MKTRIVTNLSVLKATAILLTLMMMFLFSSCEQTVSPNCEYGKAIEENTQHLDEYTQSIDKRVESIEQALTVIQEEITREDVIVDIPVTETDQVESPAPLSAFDTWIAEELANPERHKYEVIIEGFVNSDDEIARGWIDEGTVSFLKLIKGDTVSEADLEERPVAIYRSLNEKIGSSSYCIRDFFCVDEYGFSVSTGIYNFLRAVNELEAEKFGGNDIVFIENGKVTGWDFDAAGGDDVIANALGISKELVNIFMYAAMDTGFKVNMN